MLQECEYLEQDMDEIQREYEERKQEWELLEKTIKIRKKKKSLILIRDLMKGRRRAEVNILLRQGLEVFYRRGRTFMEQIYGGTVGSAFRTVCMDRRFCFCDRRVRSCGRRL